MLDFLKGKRKGNCIGSPCKGKAVALTEVPDPTFSEKILGDGFAVIPSEGKIYAPADGEVTVVFDTLHAITMTTDQGAELLIHIGLDTVTLKGAPFTAHVAAGDHVKKGDLLLDADLEKIQEAGLHIITPVLVCNTDEGGRGISRRGRAPDLLRAVRPYQLTKLTGAVPVEYNVKEEKCMKFLQKLGKALMLPVAVLPICGILMGIGYRLCPATMQGGEISGMANLIGLFLVKAGGALIDNMAILFAIGVGVGMSEKNDGTGAIAALASWLMLTTLLSTGFVTTIMPSIAEDATKTLAFDKIANPFIGIIAGIIGSMCYNKFKDTKLPDWLSFFSGKRCVAIVAGVVSILASVVLLFVWPLLFGGLVALGEAIVGLDVVGAGIYAFLNRLLIPTGLHHALNNVFWFDTIGLGDLKHFWAGETSADVSWSLGMYMSGFFPCMMFGIPGAALAMVKCAKPAKKKAAIGLVASAAICSFICGVTEPFEFAFMFLAPGLYVIYAALYGIFTMITVALGFRAGFSFSAGAMDLFFSSSLPAAARIWLIIPLGIAAFVVFYFVFLFAIKKWDLKTPGREDDDVEAEKKIELANDDFAAIAATILEGCGGKDNIASIDNCITRLRLEVKDITAVDDKVIKSAGVAGVMKPGKTSVQVIIGPKVQFVADAFSKLCE